MESSGALGPRREGNFDRTGQRRPAQAAGGPARPESLSQRADAGRPGLGALRFAGHHRVFGRALSASAVDAHRSGDAGAIQGGALSRRAGLVRPGQRYRAGDAVEDRGAQPQGVGRGNLRQRRRVQGETVFPGRRVFAGRCQHRTDLVASAVLRYRPAGTSTADREVHEFNLCTIHLPLLPVRGRTGNAPLKPRRPYLLRALHEWITDSGETPHIVVDAAAEGVTVPRQYVKDGKIVLNVSFSATQMLKLGNDFVSFEARFGGVGFAVQVPVRAILGIYARETGQGMIFPEGDADPDPTDGPPAAPATSTAAPGASKRPKLQVVK